MDGGPTDDPLGAKRHGFTEPDMAFLPDGSLFVLLRTTDGLGIAPSYFSRSRDGRSWTRPRRFDDRGVWPRLLTLRCGITLAVYGRTGFFLRATASPDAGLWDEKIPIVPPGAYQTETCSYGDLVATGDDTAVVIHSNFQWPNAERKPLWRQNSVGFLPFPGKGLEIGAFSAQLRSPPES